MGALGPCRVFWSACFTNWEISTSDETVPTVDHVDGNRNNNHVTNLEFVTNTENIQRSHRMKPVRHRIAIAKPIHQMSLETGAIIRTFPSANAAAKAIGANVGFLSNCASNRTPTAYGFRWKYEEQPDLQGEVWTTNQALIACLTKKLFSATSASRIRVSNKGRVLTAAGIKTFGSIEHKQYRNFGGMAVHRMVYLGHHGEIPEGLFVLHNDSIPKDAEGCVSNAIEHLRLGTLRENQLEYHAAKKKRRLELQAP